MNIHMIVHILVWIFCKRCFKLICHFWIGWSKHFQREFLMLFNGQKVCAAADCHFWKSKHLSVCLYVIFHSDWLRRYMTSYRLKRICYQNDTDSNWGKYHLQSHEQTSRGLSLCGMSVKKKWKKNITETFHEFSSLLQ